MSASADTPDPNADTPPEPWRTPADELREGLHNLDERVRGLCRDHPLAVLLGATAAGFLFGRLVSRR